AYGGPQNSGPRPPPADHDDLFALGEDGLDIALRLITHTPVLLRQEIHREMDALELTAGDGQVARLLAAASEHHRIVVLDELVGRYTDANMCVVVKNDGLGLHLLDTPVDVNLFHLEVGDAVPEQSAGFCPAFIDMHFVPSARKLLRASKACRSRTNDGDLLAGLALRLIRFEPLGDCPIGNLAFD